MFQEAFTSRFESLPPIPPIMKRTSAFAVTAFIALASSCSGQVLFIERFESPQIALGDYLEISSGTATFDNPDWLVSNISAMPAEEGVFIDNKFLFNTDTSQVLGLGGGQAPAGNQIERLISGFTGTTAPTISYDYFTMGTETQGIQVDVTDPDNFENLLYRGSFISSGRVNGMQFAVPTGDSIRLKISQIGSTINSDSGIDNIQVTALRVPEPSAAMLALLGVATMVGLRRRR